MSSRKKWQPTTFYPGNARGRRKLRRYLHRNFLMVLKLDEAFRAPFSIAISADFENGPSWEELAVREPYNVFSPGEIQTLSRAPGEIQTLSLAPSTRAAAAASSYLFQEARAFDMQREMNAKLDAEMVKLGYVKAAQVQDNIVYTQKDKT